MTVFCFVILFLLLRVRNITSEYNMKHRKVEESKQFVDIGLSFNENTIHLAGKTPFTVTKKQNSDVRINYAPFYTLNDYFASEHGGTHLDAPYQFHETGWKVADIPLTNLLVPGILLDMRNETGSDPSFLLKPRHLLDWELKYGRMPNNTVLLINFGWTSREPDERSYHGLDDNADTTCHFPGISEEAAEWIVESRRIVGVGVDTASVDTGATADLKVHQILSSANIYNIEKMNFNVDVELPARGFDLIVMPMKIAQGTGAPCRIVAVTSRCDSANYESNCAASECLLTPILVILVLLFISRTV